MCLKCRAAPNYDLEEKPKALEVQDRVATRLPVVGIYSSSLLQHVHFFNTRLPIQYQKDVFIGAMCLSCLQKVLKSSSMSISPFQDHFNCNPAETFPRFKKDPVPQLPAKTRS
jgi:hypothetical protein